MITKVRPTREGGDAQHPTVDEDTASPTAQVRDLMKYFVRKDGTEVKAIDGVSLDIRPREFLVLLGPSGCGKTTLLRTVAGLESADAGSISVQSSTVYSGEEGIELPPERRNLAMIFQSYALWPHMSVFDNVAYPLRQKSRHRLSKSEVKEKVGRVMRAVGIGELGEQFPSHLSGGQQQRVALARAVVAESQLVLFDEPLSNVDAKVREQLRMELLEMQERLGFSALYVTHDQSEAMGLGDRIAVLKEGRVAQLGGPQEIYSRPTSRYVANFVGNSNEVFGEVTEVRATGDVTVATDLGTMCGVAGVDRLSVGDRVAVVWRPEKTILTTGTPTDRVNTWSGTVEAALFLGPYREHFVRVGQHEFRTRDAHQLLHRGDDVSVSVRAEDARVLPEDS